MSKTNWKRVVPHSIVHALQLIQKHGEEKHNLSAQRIADRLSISKDLFYKWAGDGKMPIKHIIAYEQICGINLITQYLAHSQGHLLVPVPTGRKAEHKDLIDLQGFMIEVSGLLMRNTQGNDNAQETIGAIKKLMQDLAFHQGIVAKAEQPQHELSLVSHE